MIKHQAVLLCSVLLGIFWLSAACKRSQEQCSMSELKLIKSYLLDIKEPSGITYNQDYSGYWIVNGGKGRICKTDLGGKVLNVLTYKGEDIEAVYYDRADSTLWIAEERARDLVHLNLNGDEIGRLHIDITGKENKGFEGVVRLKNGNFYVANEQKPTAVLLIDPKGNIKDKYTINFASDLSDIDYDQNTENFYLLSDESAACYIWNPRDGLIKTFSLPGQKYEGIAFNPNNHTITVVNDKTRRMEIYELKR
jgi:uncharacterized protein YjiK